MSPIVAADAAGVARAVALLRQGEVVAFPTESSYGLAVDALDAQALARLFAIKGRPAGQPPPVLITGEAMLTRLVAQVPEVARELAARHWPGGLTLALPAHPDLPAFLVAEGHVGVRESPHPVVRALVEAFGGPLTATSANLSGEPPALCASEAALEGVALVLDAPVGGAPASTVARVRIDGTIEVLRQGAVVL
jgi:L-threonylcarbamoyladenylate synthase